MVHLTYYPQLHLGAFMLLTTQIFILAAVFCLLTFLVLLALRSKHVQGLNQILLATVLGIAGNLLYAFGRELPPVLAYEAANGVYASATAALFVGYRYLFKRRSFAKPVAAAVVALTALIAFFRYIDDSFLARSVVVSLYQVGVSAGIAATLLGARRQWERPYYPKIFILSMCGLVAGGHVIRILWLGLHPVPTTSLLMPSGWSVALLSANTFALPALAFGGLLLVHRRIVAQAERAANYDFLTDTLSRRAFFQIARREIHRTSRTGRPLSVMLIDFDNFKPINDKHGHEGGDTALLAFAKRAQAALRGSDCLARMGGDEFAVLMPETTLESASSAATRLKHFVQTEKNGDILAGVTLSIGVAEYATGDSLEHLLKRADIGLYQAKEGGRNRVVCTPRKVGDLQELQDTR